MKGKAIYFLLAYHVVTRTLSDFVDKIVSVQMCIDEACYTYGDLCYYILDAGFIGVLAYYIFGKSERTVASLLSFLCILMLSFSQAMNTLLMTISDDYVYYLPTLILTFTGVITFVLIFRNRYSWRKQASDRYDPSKIQAIYNKPKTFLSLLGATISFSPKCSVRYSHNGQTIRFSKNQDTPILETTILKGSEIIETIDFEGSFLDRFEEVKHRTYNLFSFNCRNLLNN